MAFRFIGKGDLQRMADRIESPLGTARWTAEILCSGRAREVPTYRDIFVYGGLELLVDLERPEEVRFLLALGHNDGWYTHHPGCSGRPIDWSGEGDYVGHYCDRGWLFVSPGRAFRFDPSVLPPSGGFADEALRKTDDGCWSEETPEGGLAVAYTSHINTYMELQAATVCGTRISSVAPCNGPLIEGKEPRPWLSLFNLGYWPRPGGELRHVLHLAEGAIRFEGDGYPASERGTYCYGFATGDTGGGLLDMATNKDLMGVPAETEALLYLYPVGGRDDNWKRGDPLATVSPKLAAKLIRESQQALTGRDGCPFLDERNWPERPAGAAS